MIYNSAHIYIHTLRIYENTIEFIVIYYLSSTIVERKCMVLIYLLYKILLLKCYTTLTYLVFVYVVVYEVCVPTSARLHRMIK